jgi:hypothetical protein
MADKTDSLDVSAQRPDKGSGTYLLTRDLMLDAVPYSVVNILAVWEIWDPIQVRQSA